MPYSDKEKQRRAQAESKRRRRALKRSTGSPITGFDGEPLLSLRTIGDTLTALERAIQLVLEDPEADSVSRARTIVQAASTAARAIESTELGQIERRLAEMEQLLTDKANRHE